MPVSFELFVARRYLKARRKEAVISVITAISVLGVAAGVMALIVALAVTISLGISGMGYYFPPLIKDRFPSLNSFQIGWMTAIAGTFVRKLEKSPPISWGVGTSESCGSDWMIRRPS